MPSCIRAPPELATVINGILYLTACSAALTIPSPTAIPIEPPIKEKSNTASTHLMPPMVPFGNLDRILIAGRFAIGLQTVGIFLVSLNLSGSSLVSGSAIFRISAVEQKFEALVDV